MWQDLSLMVYTPVRARGERESHPCITADLLWVLLSLYQLRMKISQILPGLAKQILLSPLSTSALAAAADWFPVKYD